MCLCAWIMCLDYVDYVLVIPDRLAGALRSSRSTITRTALVLDCICIG